MSAEWNRPRLQRQELGPILHDFGHQIYDQAELSLVKEGIGTTPFNTNELADFADVAIDAAKAAMDDVVTSDSSYVANRLIDRYHNFRRTNTGAWESLTHNNNLNALMNEGLQTGIVAPLQLYSTITSLELQTQNGPLELSQAMPINPEEAAARIGTEVFDEMLHQLATFHSETLGISSNSASRLRVEDPNQPNAFDVLKEFGWKDSFVLDGNGKVAGLSPELLGRIKKQKAGLRNGGSRLANSGGCPVRHEDFTVLGEYAQSHFDWLEAEDDRPGYEGESLISRGGRFVCTLLLKSSEEVIL